MRTERNKGLQTNNSAAPCRPCNETDWQNASHLRKKHPGLELEDVGNGWRWAAAARRDDFDVEVAGVLKAAQMAKGTVLISCL